MESMDDRDSLAGSFALGSTPKPEASSNKAALIGIALGAIGLILGLTGIIMANTAAKKAQAVELALLSRPDPGAKFEAQLKEMDERIVRAGAEIARLSRTDRQVRDNTAQLEMVTRGLTTTREEFNKLVDSMRDVQATRPVAAAPARTAPTGGSGGPDPVASTATGAWPADGIYTIQSGDTFSRIAARFNIKLEDLERVNPGVDSRRLQIGQKIQLPKP
jgi:hypothetical protein